ncbi:hypothetical protein IWZ01DRAFT_185606 [Phyllosticta capitalensis]
MSPHHSPRELCKKMSRTRLQDRTIRIAPPEGLRLRRSPGSSAQICRPVSLSSWLAPTAAAAPSIALLGMFCEVGSSLLLVLFLLWGEEAAVLLVSCLEDLWLLESNVLVKVDVSCGAIDRMELVRCVVVDLESRNSSSTFLLLDLQSPSEDEMKLFSLSAMIPTPASQHGRLRPALGGNSCSNPT